MENGKLSMMARRLLTPILFTSHFGYDLPRRPSEKEGVSFFTIRTARKYVAQPEQTLQGISEHLAPREDAEGEGVA
jgi:hypothetical protein